MASSTTFSSVGDLRERYGRPSERARQKTLAALDDHMRRFIALSPFVCLGTCGPDGADVTPRGDAPGFVQVLDPTTLLVPDWPGNNRFDSLANVLANPAVGLLFLIPGVNETLRVNGEAEITVDADVLERWTVNGKHPRSALRVTVREAYLHCAKAFIRSKLWSDEARVSRDVLPSYGAMLKDQVCVTDSAEEIQASVEKAYRDTLY